MRTEILDNCWLEDLSVKGDHRGRLISLEGDRNVPFAIERIYYIYGTDSATERGFHAHVALQQLAVCVSGRCTMRLDNGRDRRDVVLNRPDQAIYIGSMIWREMRDFTPDCVLMVLADARYDEGDYIRDYDRFMALVKEQ